MKAKQRIVDAVRERTSTDLVEALERGTQAWPLPPPPRQDPDFPPIPPTVAENLVTQGLGLFRADVGAFERHLMSSVELVVPYRMGLSEDPYEQHEKWLLRRLENVSDRVLFSTCTDWLASALDEGAPDTDRWWLAIALLNGLSTGPDGQAVHQGYHLLESIALAQRPGTWHTSPDPGPHQLEWDPQAIIPRMSLEAHASGTHASVWLMSKLEEGDDERRRLLIEWLSLLLERRELVEPLQLPAIMKRRASDTCPQVASKVAISLPRLIEADAEAGKATLAILNKRSEVEVQRVLADVLTRLFRRIEWDAVPMLESMLKSEDDSVLAAASATVGDLKFLDQDRWADEILNLVDHPSPLVRRNLVSTLRDYITAFPDDERSIFPSLWLDGDEVVRSRLRELMLRMEEVDPDRFSIIIKRIATQSETALSDLWASLEVRNLGRPEAWKAWLKGESPPPAITPVGEEEKGPQTNIEMELDGSDE